MPTPGILHGYQHVTIVQLGGHRDMSSRLGVLAGVVEQIAECLSEPHRIGIEIYGRDGQRHGQFVPGGLHCRAAGFNRLMDSRRQVDRLAAKLNLTLAYAVHVQEIIHQTDHLTDLSLHDLESRLDCLSVALFVSNDLEGVAHWCEGVPKFMGQHRQELVLAPVGLFQRLFGVCPLQSCPDSGRQFTHQLDLVLTPGCGLLNRKYRAETATRRRG